MTPYPKPAMRPPKPRKRADHNRHRVLPIGLRTKVLERAGYRCERCGTTGRLDMHHKLRRSQGGKDDERTLVALDRRCHEWVHGNPAEARAEGFLVRSEDEL